MTLGVSTLGGTASVFAAEQPVQELPKLLNDLSGEFNSPLIKSEEVSKIMSDASKDARRLNDLLRQISMGVAGKIPAVGSVVSAMVGYLYPEQDGTDSKLNALEAKLTAKIEQAVNDQHVKDIKSHIQNLTNAANELQTALNSVNKGAFYDGGSIKDIHGTLREKAETVDKKFKELMPFLMQEGHEIGDLPVYTKVAAAHILFLNYMKTRGTDSKLYRYDSDKTVDAQFQPTDRVDTYAKHIEDTFKKGDDKIVQLIKELEDKKEALRNVGSSTGGSLAGGNLGAENKRSILNKEIDGLKALNLNRKRSLYRDLTVAEGSFEAASGKKLTYTHFADILSGTYKIVSKLDSSMILDNDYGHERLAKLNKDYTDKKEEWVNGEKWTFQYNADKKAYKIINQKAPYDELAINGKFGDDTVFATTDRKLDSDSTADLRYWKVEDAGNGYFFIKNLKTGRVLDVTDGKTGVGTVIKTHAQNASPVAAQMFKIETVQ
ncbi:insecticidal delta-endotoxin Cry8Ea1 family protein [Bacillus sp. 2SH]|nr:insecticidal delta-endotoxin Cry8Ea1 family protein [Bacillus sp. 2SH]